MNLNTKILIVDDEPDILEFLEYNLRKEGFVIKKANNGLECLEMSEQFRPDLILLDIMMPKMDGVEACQNLRKNPAYDDTLIAFLTARSEDFTQILALEKGGDDYITKPIKPNLLVSRVKALLRRGMSRKGTQEQNLIIRGALEINISEFSVKVSDQDVYLPNKEFKLLKLLASRPGKVFTREEIFNKVWGSAVLVGPRTIDVHIRKLREKLGLNYITTVKGIGYKFVN